MGSLVVPKGMRQRDVVRSIAPGEEWVGGLVALPSYVTGEGEPYRPIAVMWVDAASHFIVDVTLVHPREALARAAGLFVRATREPKEGPPCLPSRVRVCDSELAAALRGSIGDVEIVVGATPELDEVVTALKEHLSDQRGGDPSFVGPGMLSSDVAAMFAAAARMYRVAPWKAFPPDVCIGVSCDILDIVDGAMIVVGQMGEAHGFSLFASMERVTAFFKAIDAHEQGAELQELPEHIMFGYDSCDELPPALVREVAEHGWEIASRNAYPSPTALDADRVGRAVARVEMVGLTAIMTALSDLVETEPAVAEAWERDDRELTWSRAVESPLGIVKVELRMPVLLPLEDSIAATEELDDDKLDEYAEAVLDELSRVPGIDDMHLRCADMLIMQAGHYFGVPLMQMTPHALERLLFEHIPAKVSIEPGVAPFVIEAARHVMTLGAERLDIDAAKKCLAFLAAPDLSMRLARALADSGRFSPTKAMIMEGIREGYDLSSERGVAAWVEELARRAQPRKRRSVGRAKAPAKPKKSKPPSKRRTSHSKRS